MAAILSSFQLRNLVLGVGSLLTPSMKVQMLWVVVKHLVVGLLEKCWETMVLLSGISVKSCMGSQNKGLSRQPGATTYMRQLY